MPLDKNLLILSGSTDISKSDYEKRYSLISNEAKKRGYKNVELLLWPGQDSGKDGLLNCNNAISFLEERLNEYEQGNTLYDIIAFSFGTNICLRAFFKKENVYKNLSRTVFWGLGQYWEYYDYFSKYGQDKHKKLHEESGYNLDKEIMSTFFPNEIMLKEYPHDNLIIVGFGEHDEISPLYFRRYLRKIVKKENIRLKKVNGIGHKVIKPNKEYFKLMFDIN